MVSMQIQRKFIILEMLNCAEGATSSECKWVSVPEVLFNRVVKRIWDLVAGPVFGATCGLTGVLGVRKRDPPASGSGPILCVCLSVFFFLQRSFGPGRWSWTVQVRKKVGQKEASVVSICTELDHFFASPLLTSPDINLFRLVCLAWGATCPAGSF